MPKTWDRKGHRVSMEENYLRLLAVGDMDPHVVISCSPAGLVVEV